MKEHSTIGDDINASPMFASFNDYIYESKKQSTFSTFSSHQLAEVVREIGRRLLILRVDDADAPFWFDVLIRVEKYLRSSPELNEVEKKLILNAPPNTNGILNAARSIKARSGRGLKVCFDIAKAWADENKTNGASSVSQQCDVCKAIFTSAIERCPNCMRVVVKRS